MPMFVRVDDFVVRTVDFVVRTNDSPLRAVDFVVRTVDFVIDTLDSPVHTVDSVLCMVDSIVRTVDSLYLFLNLATKRFILLCVQLNFAIRAVDFIIHTVDKRNRRIVFTVYHYY